MAEEQFYEFPKMVYKHPEDKSKEHTFVIVNNCDEQDKAFAKGFQIEPYVPETDKQMDTIVIVQGSGSERYNEAGDWTQSAGEGITYDTSKVLVPVEQDSPKDVLEHQHMNEKDNGEKIEEEG